MTNASVKPALSRIENKLEKIDKIMNELCIKTKNETEENENPGPTVEKLYCECKSIGVEQKTQQEKEEKLGESESE